MSSMPWTEDYVKRVLTNPLYCLPDTSDDVCGPQEAVISEDHFIEAGEKIIGDIGARKYLQYLLENLKGNYVPAEAK